MTFRTFALGIATVLAAHVAFAQSFPSRPIRMIVPQPAGGSMDSNARALAEPLERAFGQNIVIDNRSGANGIIAGEIVARAPADGHTMLYTSNSFINNQIVHKKLPFDVLKDFAAITNVAKLPGYLVLVNAQTPVQTMQELIALGKSGKRVNFGSGGIGNSQHLLGELINLRAGTKLTHVPYKGFAPMITALLGNEIQVAFGAPTTVIQHVKAGRLRVVGYTAAKRWSVLPEVPTVGEAGIPGFVYEAAWHGMFAPVATPAAAVARVRDEVAKAIQTPKIRAHLENGGYVPVGDSPAEFRSFVASDLKTVADLARRAGVEAQ